MKSDMKEKVHRLLRRLFAPVRHFYRRRNGKFSENGVRQEIPNELFLGLVSEKLREGHSAVIWVKGFSMRPFLENERDRVKLGFPETLSVGDAVLAQIQPGHYVLHRIIRLDGDQVTLQGDGNIDGVEKCLRKDVCGIVTEYIRPSRTLRSDDPQLMRKIQWWRRLRPIRRYLLVIYKAIV